MTSYELILAIKDYCNNDNKETVVQVNDLLVQLMDNPREFTNRLANELEEFCTSHDLCPQCGSKIMLLKSDQVQEEYQGLPVDREENTYGCEECGYIIE